MTHHDHISAMLIRGEKEYSINATPCYGRCQGLISIQLSSTVIDVLSSQIRLLRTLMAVSATEVENIGQFSRSLPFIFFSFDILEIGNAIIDAAIY